MLSRVADNLYWMSRYLERAEHTARLVDVNLSLDMEQSSGVRATVAGAICWRACACRRPSRDWPIRMTWRVT